ncbi:MAG: hypothetical protein ACOYMF_05770 [Bacteroidales bacterium]
MNSGVIVKAEYKLIGNSDFTDLDIIPYSGTISETWKKPFEGLVATVQVDFKKENWGVTNDATMKLLLNKKAVYRITDGNGTKFIVGTSSKPARMLYVASVDPGPGGFNGFTCNISWLSVTGCTKS